jgi:hypothetical protein
MPDIFPIFPEDESGERLSPTREIIYEPEYCSHDRGHQCSSATSGADASIAQYLSQCAAYARSVFAQDHAIADTAAPDLADVRGLADVIVGILLNHEFNHQSRGRVAHLLPAVREAIIAQIARHQPIQLFISYNGGYHATTRSDFSRPLGFDAAATELLLLFMIARLKERLVAVYPPGMICQVVLNNGVAHFVNDIPLQRTEAYAQRLEDMIARLGGRNDVRVLVQSRLGDFTGRMREAAMDPAQEIDAATHHNIERFLGRPCSTAEARLRLGRYAPAEAAWWQELRQIIAAANGIRLLQVASPHFLSFRPFPGGATRSQTGQIGFRINSGKVVPTLVTTATFLKACVLATPICLPSVLAPAASAQIEA